LSGSSRFGGFASLSVRLDLELRRPMQLRASCARCLRALSTSGSTSFGLSLSSLICRIRRRMRLEPGTGKRAGLPRLQLPSSRLRGLHRTASRPGLSTRCFRQSSRHIQQVLARSGCVQCPPIPSRPIARRPLLPPLTPISFAEVKRKSVMDREHDIYRLLQDGPQQAATHDISTGHEHISAHESQLYDLILTLWHTALLRVNKLTVQDEIENGTNVFKRTFLRVVPSLHMALERQLKSSGMVGPDWALPSVLRIGSWIG
jgi:hypothetical protein